MLLVDYIFRPLDTTDVSIALMLTGAVYLFGSILSLPSAILTGISFILISAHFSRLPTIILTSLVAVSALALLFHSCLILESNNLFYLPRWVCSVLLS